MELISLIQKFQEENDLGRTTYGKYDRIKIDVEIKTLGGFNGLSWRKMEFSTS